MSQLPPKLIDCPKCGDISRVSGWDGRADWRCQNCGLVLLRAISPGQDPETSLSLENVSLPAQPASTSPNLRRKLKRWTDIHRLPSPEELESMDPQPKPPEWLVRPAIPQPSVKRDLLPGPVGPPPPGNEPSPPVSSSLPADNQNEEPVAWEIGEVEQFQPREKPEPPATGTRGRKPPGRYPRMLTFFAVILLVCLSAWLIHSVWNSRDRQTSAPIFESRGGAGEEWRKQVPALAERFANASTAEEWLSMARDPERVAPLVHAFKPSFAKGRPLGIKAFGTEPFAGDELFQFSVTYEDGRSRLIHVIFTEDGPKVDWESFARSGGAGFGELTAPTEVEAELRVLVRRARYYNYNFADDRRWRAYEILNGDWPEPFTGYAPMGSLSDDTLFRITGPNVDASPVRVILKVRAGGDDGARGQMEILEFVQQGWVKP